MASRLTRCLMASFNHLYLQRSSSLVPLWANSCGRLWRDITLSVYMDDIAISSPSRDVLQKVFRELTIKIQEANFPINLEKTMPPTELMNLFNCELELNRASVLEARRAAFYAGMPSAAACEAFERYCQSIECGNEWAPVA